LTKTFGDSLISVSQPMIDILKNEYLQISGLFPVVFFNNELHKSKNEFVKKIFLFAMLHKCTLFIMLWISMWYVVYTYNFWYSQKYVNTYMKSSTGNRFSVTSLTWITANLA
jgi:hypothetical protein